MNKKIFLIILISVFTLISWAQSQSGYMPFHQYLQKQHGDIQNRPGNERAIVYKEIGYSHNIFLKPTGTWNYADSGVYSYNLVNQQVWETGGVFYKFPYMSWEFNSRFTDSVNNIGLVQTTIGQNYDSAASSWTNSYEYAYTYYSSNNYVYTETLLTSSNNSWVDSIQYIYTYDSSNYLIKKVFQVWSGGAWQNDSQYLYTNNTYMNTQLITQAWVSGNWVNVYKQNNSFDANSNNYQSFISSWSGSGWINYALIIKGYDLNNELVSYVSELWNSNTGVYVNNYQEAYAYVLGNNTEFENYNWDTTRNTWAPQVLNTYSFDGNHNVIYELDQAFAAGTFGNTDQYFYSYMPFTVSGMNSLKNEMNLCIFPNPSSGNNVALSFTADYTTSLSVNVYDAQGRILKHIQLAANQGANQIPLNLQGLAAGNYFVRVSDNNRKGSVLKFVKQ